MALPARACRWPRVVAGLTLAGLLGALVTLAAVYYASGGRWFDVVSPSMGESAPVGSLVLTRPVTDLSQLQVGETISYREQGPDRVITHRVVAVTPGSATAPGTVTTRGDLNAANDPQPVALGQIIGRETAVIFGGGWLVRAVPILAAATMIIWLVGARVRDWLDRRVCWVVGEAFVLAVTLLALRPLVGIDEVVRTLRPDGVSITFVSTGLLPVRVSSGSGSFADLVAGQTGTVQSGVPGTDGRYWFVPTLHLDWLGWAVAAVVVSLPTVLVLWWCHRYARLAVADDGGPALPRRAPGGRVATLILVGGLAPVLAWGSALHPASNASFSASIGQPSSAGSRTFFTCRAAESTTPGRFVAYALGTAGTSESDLTGNGYTGTYTLSVTPTGSSGCTRDSPAAAVHFDGLLTCLNTPSAASQTSPNTFSLEAWFSTTATGSGKIIGFSSAHGVLGLQYDRHLYVDPSGRLVFGANSGSAQIAASPPGKSYADGVWHHVVATLSQAGMMLYADGRLVASNSAVTSGQAYTGYWEIGCGSLTGWPAADGSAYLLPPSYFTGNIQYAAVYSRALTQTQVTEHYLAGAP